MSATFHWCERNGRSPGSETIGISNANWKAVDDVTTVYTDPSCAIVAGTNSYTKYNYGRFSGNYTTIANIKFTHHSGVFGPGLFLMCQKPMTQDSDRLAYATPTRMIDNTNTTPYNLTQVGSSVTIFVGPTGPADSGKSAVAFKPEGDGYLWTNYIVTQLQTTTAASQGDTSLVVLRLQHDEA